MSTPEKIIARFPHQNLPDSEFINKEIVQYGKHIGAITKIVGRKDDVIIVEITVEPPYIDVEGGEVDE